MKITDFFKRKSAVDAQSMTLNQLLDFLGIAETDSSVLSEATYYACIKVLMESVGKLPLKLQVATDTQGVKPARNHRYYRMLNERPNKYMSASVFWSTMEMHRNHYGNAYAYIDESDPKKPQLWPLDPACMRVVYDDVNMFGAPNVYYYYSTKNGTRVFLSEELLHFKSHHTEAGLVGIPVRDQLSATIKGNNKAQALVNRLYDSGMTGKAVLQYTSGLSDANADAMAKGIQDYLNGKKIPNGVENVIPLPLGMTLTPLNLKLTDSQFMEIKQYTALQIASAFGVRPYQIGDYTKSSYASAEAQQLSFLIDTLLFIVKGYEEEVGYKLLSDKEEAKGLHAKFNTAVLLRADQRTQIETLSTAVNSFLMTPNEARSRLDLPAKDGGDELLGNGASIPVQHAGSQYTTTAREEEKAWLKEIIKEALSEKTLSA
ncbi:MAG: phage portal protein [Bacteroidales bacterium]|nr:phage portal protein [Bacteroidales bacterium]